MAKDIVNTLTLMCDKNNPQDKKLLLLAELVESRFASIAERQAELQESLADTNKKMDKVTELLEESQREGKDCPVYKNKANFEKVSFLLKYPRFSLLMLIGLVALFAGFLGSNIIPYIKLAFGL